VFGCRECDFCTDFGIFSCARGGHKVGFGHAVSIANALHEFIKVADIRFGIEVFEYFVPPDIVAQYSIVTVTTLNSPYVRWDCSVTIRNRGTGNKATFCVNKL